MRDNAIGTASVTDQRSAIVNVASSVMRVTFEQLQARAKAVGLTKAAYIRKLIEDDLRT